MPLGVIFDEFLGFKFDFVGEFDIKPFDTWSDFGESLGFSNALFLSFWRLRANSARQQKYYATWGDFGESLGFKFDFAGEFDKRTLTESPTYSC